MGFCARECSRFFSWSSLESHVATSTVLAGGSHPGPLIAANRGQPFAIKVTDSLTDGTMLKGTSVVSRNSGAERA